MVKKNTMFSRSLFLPLMVALLVFLAACSSNNGSADTPSPTDGAAKPTESAVLRKPRSLLQTMVFIPLRISAM